MLLFNNEESKANSSTIKDLQQQIMNIRGSENVLKQQLCKDTRIIREMTLSLESDQKSHQKEKFA